MSHSAKTMKQPTARRLGVLRYMGNKLAFLDDVLASAAELAEPGTTVVDAMAGSHAVSYALKGRHVLLTSDAQEYSACLGRAFIDNTAVLQLSEDFIDELRLRAEALLARETIGFLESSFSGTYLGARQCRQLDVLRQAVDELCPDDKDAKRWLVLSSIMTAACRGQASPGHFAQFLPNDHPRTQSLRRIDMFEVCFKTLSEIQVAEGLPGSRSFALPWRDLVAQQGSALADVSLWYLDPPYTRDQYSRFYHFLETLVRGDEPTLRFKARYREDRFRSAFCLSTQVASEFRSLFENVRAGSPRASALLSYSSRGLLTREELIEAAAPHFELVASRDVSHTYSTQGKGNLAGVTEYLLSFRPRG